MTTAANAPVDPAQSNRPDDLSGPADAGEARLPFHRRNLTLVHLDRDLAVQQANREFFRIFGNSSRQLVGLPFIDLVRPGVRQPLLQQFTGLIEGRRDRVGTRVIAVDADDTAFHSSLTAHAVRGGTSEISAIMVVMETFAEPVGPDTVTGRMKLLSKLEARILEGIAGGVSTVPLAARLYLSRQGVEYHVNSLFRKLKVPNRAALVSRAYSTGVLKVGAWPPEVAPDAVK
uniref:LuxR transcription regulator n=1 Tax=Nocardiopsis sp. CMB-M0232 TaxID=1231934 RepID=A0A0D5BTV1_9ACTN|nr:LuxR transcription regulator [Nocardiopsis sp. CMB-M0232]